MERHDSNSDEWSSLACWREISRFTAQNYRFRQQQNKLPLVTRSRFSNLKPFMFHTCRLVCSTEATRRTYLCSLETSDCIQDRDDNDDRRILRIFMTFTSIIKFDTVESVEFSQFRVFCEFLLHRHGNGKFRKMQRWFHEHLNIFVETLCFISTYKFSAANAQLTSSFNLVF